MYIYKTYFKLRNEVNNLRAAQEYLSEDDMTAYLVGDDRIAREVRDAVVSIRWILTDEQSGAIVLITKTELSAEQLLTISDWVSGQNSDGLGEGFEQQDFACYTVESESVYYTDDDDEDEDYPDDEYVTASFDWTTNKYIFELSSTYA